MSEQRKALWRSVGGITECGDGHYHAWVVLVPLAITHKTRYRVCVSEGHALAIDALDVSLAYASALADVARDRTIKALPALDDWSVSDVDVLDQALPPEVAAAAAYCLDEMAARTDAVDAVDRVNASGGEA